MNDMKYISEWDAERAMKDFEVDRVLLAEVLDTALSRGGDFGELYFQDLVSVNLYLDDHLVRSASQHVVRGVGLRVLKGDQMGFSHCVSMDRASLLKAADIASRIADGSRSVRSRDLTPRPVPAIYSDGDSDFDIAALRTWLESVDAAVSGLDSRVIKCTAGSYASRDRILIVNSEGLIAHDDRPDCGSWVQCVAQAGDRCESNGTSRGWRRRQSAVFTPALAREMAREVVASTVELFDAVEAPAGEFPLVLEAGEGGILVHEAMGHGFEADFIRKNTSIFSGRLGQRCAPDFVNIFDTGIHSDDRGSLCIDDEGTPAQETCLVRNGTLESWMHDRVSARHFNLAPTGNGRRQCYQDLPIPRMRSTSIAAGPHDREEIIASTKWGIYARQFSNGQVNIGQGDFTFYMKRGYLIENGRLGRPIKDVNIIGNGPKILEELEMVGNDLVVPAAMGGCGKNGQSVPISCGSPTLKLHKITVGGRS